MVAVITSGKGGAGKSTVSAGLGCALARRGRRVLLVDGDAGLRSLDMMLGVAGSAVYDLADVTADRCAPGDAVYPAPVCAGVFVLPAPIALAALASAADMARLCRGFSRFYDDVIVDCPAGIGRGFEAAVAGADRAFVVSTPDKVCARDAQIVARLLRARGLPARLLINRLRPGAMRRGRGPDVDEVIDTASLQLIGIVPEDEAVADAGAMGRPLPQESAAAGCFARIAARYLGEDVPLGITPKGVLI